MLNKLVKMGIVLCAFFSSGLAVAQSREDFEKFREGARQRFNASSQQMRANMGNASQRQSGAVYQDENKTGLLKVPVYSKSTGKTYFLSPKAAGKYARSSSFNGLVQITVSDGDVYVLPDEKISFPVWYEAEKNKLARRQKQTENAVEASAAGALCPSNTPECEDLLVLWARMGIVESDLPKYVAGAQRDGFSQTLIKDKRLCLGQRDAAVAVVERRQRARLLGNNYDVSALEDFMWDGAFTAAGWASTFRQFCQDGRGGKLNEAQIRQIKSFAKKTGKALEKKEIPVIRFNNRDPWGLQEEGALKSALHCAMDL